MELSARICRLLRRAALGYFIAFAGLLAYLTPVFEPPDEWNHVDYVNFVARMSALPNQLQRERTVRNEGHQPPLYYFLGALVVRTIKDDHYLEVHPAPNRKGAIGPSRTAIRPIFDHVRNNPFPSRADRAAFYALRGLSIAMAALNVWLIGALASRFIAAPGWALLPVLLVATLPQFAFVSAAVNNDNAANLLATACFYFLFSMLDQPGTARNYLAFGLCLGLGILAKKTVWIVAPVAALSVGYVLWVNPGARWRILRLASLALLLAVAVSGWWFVRNYRVYGEWLGTRMEEQSLYYGTLRQPLSDQFFVENYPLSMQSMVNRLLGADMARILLPVCFVLVLFLYAAVMATMFRIYRARPTSAARTLLVAAGAVAATLVLWWSMDGFRLGWFLRRTGKSFVGLFGNMTIYMPSACYVFYAAILAGAILSPIVFGVQPRRLERKFWTSVILILASVGGLIYYNTIYPQPQGRLLFPILSLVAVLVSMALENAFTSIQPPRLRTAITSTAAAVLVAGVLLCDALSVRNIHAFYYRDRQWLAEQLAFAAAATAEQPVKSFRCESPPR